MFESVLFRNIWQTGPERNKLLTNKADTIETDDITYSVTPVFRNIEDIVKRKLSNDGLQWGKKKKQLLIDK